MENENKKTAPSGAKYHHKKHRHKGYFIDPATKPEANVSENSKAAQKPERTERKPQNGGNAQHTQAPRHSQRPQGNTEKSAERADRPEKNVQKSNEAPKDGNTSAKKHNRNRRHRNRHHNNPADNAQKQEFIQGGENTVAIDKTLAAPSAERTPRHTPRFEDKLPTEPRKKELPPIDDEYEEIHFPAESTSVNTEQQVYEEEEPAPMVEVVGIRFKSTGKIYYFDPSGKQAKRGDHAIVETARGQEYGEVAMPNTMVKESDTVPPLRPILRIATDADKAHHEENKVRQDEAFKLCNEKIIAHGLDMKLIDAQYTFDNSKLLFYFTSAGRVDFRELVKDLASLFRTRIELRQIGIRDEAKLMGGMGMCGRPLCCTLFLSDFGQVSIKMAKEQNLSLNSAKISGICGRLMCCLRYEHETYEYEIKRTPPVDSIVRTVDGNGVVTEISPLAGNIKVKLRALILRT